MPNLTHCAGCGRQLSLEEMGATHCRGCVKSITAGRGPLPRKYGSILDTKPPRVWAAPDPNQQRLPLEVADVQEQKRTSRRRS